MAKVNFLNQAESFMSESYISQLMSESYILQLHINANKKTRKWRYFILGVMERKFQKKTEKD